MITLIGGPADNIHVSSELIRGDEVRMKFDITPRRPISFKNGPIAHVSRVVREAVYHIRDSESGVANWVGWADEIPDPNPLLTEALGNATDAEILKLMGRINK